jgi:hypothetical protein
MASTALQEAMLDPEAAPAIDGECTAGLKETSARQHLQGSI